MAPELDTELDADSHISGQCLRTGRPLRCHDTDNDPRVDAEACRSVGLRSVVVVPVGRKPVVSGVLEAFSALPIAFDDSQMQLLEEMAELVIVAQRHSAESDVEVASEKFANMRLSHPGGSGSTRIVKLARFQGYIEQPSLICCRPAAGRCPLSIGCCRPFAC